MAWQSPSEILAEFKIYKDSNDIEGIKQELRERLGQFHPDKTGGEFATEEQKQQFMHIQEAIDFLGRQPASTAMMIPINLLPAIINAVGELINIQPPKDAIEIRTEYRQAARRRYVLPKVTSGILALVAGFLFSLQGTLKSHPMYELFRKRIAEPYYVEDTINLEEELFSKINKSRGDLNDTLEKHSSELSEEFADKFKKVFDNIESQDPDKNFRLILPTYSRPTFITGLARFWPNHKRREFSIFEKLERTKIFAREARASIDSLENTKFASQMKNDETKNHGNIPSDITSELDFLKNEFDIYEKNIEDTKNRYLENADGKIGFVIFSLLLIASTAFILVWVRERSDDNFGDYLLTEEGLTTAFSRICSTCVRSKKDTLQFSFVDFTIAISKKGSFLTNMFLGNVNPTCLEKVATALIEKLVNRKVIKPINKTDVCQWYEIDRNIALQYAKR